MGVGSVMMPAWAITLIAGIIIGLIVFLWRDMIKRIDDIVARLDRHASEDNRVHERVTVLETKVAANEQRIQQNYDRFHRFTVETRETFTDNYKWLIEKFEAMYKWITEKIIEAIKK